MQAKNSQCVKCLSWGELESVDIHGRSSIVDEDENNEDEEEVEWDTDEEEEEEEFQSDSDFGNVECLSVICLSNFNFISKYLTSTPPTAASFPPGTFSSPVAASPIERSTPLAMTSIPPRSFPSPVAASPIETGVYPSGTSTPPTAASTPLAMSTSPAATSTPPATLTPFLLLLYSSPAPISTHSLTLPIAEMSSRHSTSSSAHPSAPASSSTPSSVFSIQASRSNWTYAKLITEIMKKRYRLDPMHERTIRDAWQKWASSRYKDLMYEVRMDRHTRRSRRRHSRTDCRALVARGPASSPAGLGLSLSGHNHEHRRGSNSSSSVPSISFAAPTSLVSRGRGGWEYMQWAQDKFADFMTSFASQYGVQ
ncbi:hypothetical protein M9H77_35109 [Catharanthus roseus]|uniref:Uncharacterized protein n=1 Tax=Catharanthus roseus TaxID=4058 RepID=A0ACB9ZNZ0_CATRO|nr:hypothetical protein M9H77_35109 [Catharanthus roseus]